MSYEHTDFFPSERFDGESDDHDAAGGELLDHREIVKELSAARRDVLDAYPGKWDKDHELELAETIQAGLSAAATKQEMGNAYDGRFDAEIAAGNAARHDLVVANLPFAAMMARTSTGRRSIPEEHTHGVPSVPLDDADYMGNLKEVGTFSRIANLAHPGASLIDRTQVAMEAMWYASVKYGSKKLKPGARTAKFSTFAAWQIQADLYQHVTTEKSGWYVDRGTLDRNVAVHNEQKLYGSVIKLRHRVEHRGSHEGLPPEQVFEGREAVHLGAVSKLALDEHDELGEARELSLDEFVPSSDVSALDVVSDQEMAGRIGEVFDTLSEREAGVISMRFGLDGDEPMTLDQAGKVYGVSRERTRQIESKTMSKLRHPSRAEYLRDAYEEPNDGLPGGHTALNPLIDGAQHIKTRRVAASGGRIRDNMTEMNSDEATDRTGLQPWQSSPDDEWDTPVRRRVQ